MYSFKQEMESEQEQQYSLHNGTYDYSYHIQEHCYELLYMAQLLLDVDKICRPPRATRPFHAQHPPPAKTDRTEAARSPLVTPRKEDAGTRLVVIGGEGAFTMTDLTPPPISPDPLLTLQQVADFLGASLRTVQRRIADGTIRPLKLKGVVRIPASEIGRLLDQVKGETRLSKGLVGNV